MDLPTNIKKDDKNNVYYTIIQDGKEIEFKVGIGWVETKIQSYKDKIIQVNENDPEMLQFYKDKRDFYQYIKDKYDTLG